MNEAQKCVELNGRTYTVYFNDAGQPQTVCSHVGKSYCQALRRLPLTGPTARAVIAKATSPLTP